VGLSRRQMPDLPSPSKCLAPCRGLLLQVCAVEVPGTPSGAPQLSKSLAPRWAENGSVLVVRPGCQ
jgi:hypothetical protein